MSSTLYPPEYERLKVADGYYIPPVGDVFDHENPHYHKPIKHVMEYVVDNNYPYMDNSFNFKFWSFMYYAQSRYLTRWLHPLVNGFKLVGKEKLYKYKDLFKDGAITVCNHMQRWDMAGVFEFNGWRRHWYPFYREQLCGPDSRRMRVMGGIPTPVDIPSTRHFYAAFDEIHRRKGWIHFYPEASRWDYYVPIRPFQKGAFAFAERYNLPIIPMAYSYRERTGWRKLFGKTPLLTLTVGDPILIDETLRGNKRELIDDLRKRSFESMLKLAGIIENPWNYNDTEK